MIEVDYIPTSFLLGFRVSKASHGVFIGIGIDYGQN
jgi:hypothetical protein